ncbi:uncharacterized protein V1513DRAFT_433276 [Lipomyces chichibuensis]|uniref:uncharacterized protein n=1 Tax=Lipomyces chichibuensis TaxID=1546026 RepID=UPI003343E5E5
MTSSADRQYPPSSPPASAPTQRVLLPSFEPTASFASVSGRKSSFSSPFKHRTPSRKRTRADTPTDDRASTPSRQRIVPSEDGDDIASRLPPLQTFYPTPAPTSSASLNASSPSKATSAFTTDGVDENIFLHEPQQQIVRAPLSTVVLARVPRNGAELTLGRSSNSSSIVLSRTNKLISRVHVATRYISSANAIEVRCLGWNGARVGTPTREYALAKGENVEIAADVNVIIDVCGERARVEVVADVEDDETDDEIFVSEKARDATISDRDASPEEQSDDPKVGFKIWEDREENSGKGVDKKENITASFKSASHRHANAEQSPVQSTVHIKIDSPSIMTAGGIPSEAGEVASPVPIAPVETGENTQTPVPKLKPSKPETDLNKLKIHIIAHLAYSRLASTPLSELRSSLPITNTLPVEILRTIIKRIPCVGVIQRQGKDASGKRLEEQYYYIPEHDDDEYRRAAVEELRGHPGIRSCRKVHKQYFWRKPALK